MRQLILSVAVVSLLSACASNKAATLDDMMKSWVGLPIETVAKRIGDADDVQKTSTGGAVYSWLTPIPDGNNTIQCVQQFRTNRNGDIIDWGYTDCPKDGWEQMGYK